ncbi:MAG TPA: aspartyl protease family protein [Vicinamibacterales bacterium]|jgi:Tfp pilus assembly protein PilF
MRLLLRGTVVLAILAACTLVGLAGSVIPSQEADVEIQIAAKLFAQGNYPGALAVYTQARSHAPEPDQQHRALAGIVRSALRVAQFEQASRAAIDLVAMQPQNPDDAALYGDALWSSGLFPEAQQQYERALTLNPRTADALNGLAMLLAARGHLQDAYNDAEAALGLAPKNEEVNHTVGMIYERMHRFGDAADAYEHYVDLLPNKDKSLKAAWSRAEIKFLRSFQDREPFAIDPADADTLHTIPFRLINNKVVVRARLNGGDERDLVLDTGAEQTTISEKTGRDVGLKPVTYTLSAGIGDAGLRGLQLARLDELQIGTLTVRNVACVIKSPSLKDMPTRESDTFSPLALGLSTRVDYARREITMGRHLPEEPVDVELPMYVNRLATVRGTVDGRHPASFVVDTGGEVISISSDMAGLLDRPQPEHRISLKVYGTSGWDRDAFLLPGVNLKFAGIAFTNFPVVVLNLRAPSVLLGYQLGGIVGQKFLGGYRVTFDLEHSVLGLKKF